MTTLKPRTTTVTLFQGDDLDAIQHRLADLARMERSTNLRLGDDDEIEAAREAYNAFADEAAERAVDVVLEALPRKRWRELLRDHPPREGNDDDKALGFNSEDFGDALVAESVAGDTFASAGACRAFLESLAEADFNRLFSAAVSLNQEPGPDPKARLSSQHGPNSGETSNSPARLG